MTTQALILCQSKKTENDIAIIARSDGMPRTLGRALAEVCKDIFYGDYMINIQENDPDLKLRFCWDYGLSAMVLGMLHEQWDKVQHTSFTMRGKVITNSRRYSHNQFSLLPSEKADPGNVHYTYLLRFKNHPPLDWYSNPKRVWITLEGPDGFEGWPEDFLAWLDVHHPDDE